MATTDYIFQDFKITDDEYAELDKEFGNLCYKAAWELKKKNFKNNYTDEIEDIVQDLRWAMSRAWIYTKRQMYIKTSLRMLEEHCKDQFSIEIIEELKTLWDNRKRHGANKQKFGFWQEKIIDVLLAQYVPNEHRPNKKSKITTIGNDEFSRYCKANIWNRAKNLGKKITREKSIRSGLTSLSEYEFLC